MLICRSVEASVSDPADPNPHPEMMKTDPVIRGVTTTGQLLLPTLQGGADIPVHRTESRGYYLAKIVRPLF